MSAGLSRALTGLPVRGGYAEVLGGLSQSGGAFARGEVGVRPWEHGAAFLFGEANQRDGWTVGAGAKFEWDW